MKIELDDLEKKIQITVTNAIYDAFISFQSIDDGKEWLSIPEAATYVNVSKNTLLKYQYEGLKFFKLDGTTRVSKKELDRFLMNNSF